MDKQDIETILEQFDENRDAATPPRLTVKYEGKKYQVYDMQLQGESVVLTLVKNNFNFGDGYYEFICPSIEEETEVWLPLTDPMLENIAHQVLHEWENTVFAFSNSVTQEDIDRIKHFKREKKVIEKLERKVKSHKGYADHAATQRDREYFLKVAEEYSQLITKF